MTQALSAAEAPATAKAQAGAGAANAFIRDGQLYVLDFGRYEPTTRFSAICIAAPLLDSQFEASRARGREILAVADRVTQ